MSFIKRLALFILIMIAMILFFGLFPVIAASAPSTGNIADRSGFIMLQLQNILKASVL